MSADNHQWPLIRTKYLDEVYEENAKAVASAEGMRKTQEEAEYIQSMSTWVASQEEDVQQIQSELLNLLYSRGCNVTDYL